MTQGRTLRAALSGGARGPELAQTRLCLLADALGRGREPRDGQARTLKHAFVLTHGNVGFSFLNCDKNTHHIKSTTFYTHGWAGAASRARTLLCRHPQRHLQSLCLPDRNSSAPASTLPPPPQQPPLHSPSPMTLATPRTWCGGDLSACPSAPGSSQHHVLRGQPCCSHDRTPFLSKAERQCTARTGCSADHGTYSSHVAMSRRARTCPNPCLQFFWGHTQKWDRQSLANSTFKSAGIPLLFPTNSAQARLHPVSDSHRRRSPDSGTNGSQGPRQLRGQPQQ